MKRSEKMYSTIIQQAKHLSIEEKKILQEQCRTAKNLVNEAIYNIRQHYFRTRTLLSYEQNYHSLKSSENYRTLNSNMSEQILRKVDKTFKSYFAKNNPVKKVNP